MKKHIFISYIAFALALALASCGPKSGADETGGSDGTSAVPPEALQPGTAEVYDIEAAAKELLSSFTEYPEGSYLADASFATDEYLPGFDLDPAFDVSDLAHNIAADDNFIYLCERGHTDKAVRLYRADKKTKEVSPLCSVPGCTHEDESCGAYICGKGESVFSFRIYDGALLWIQQGRTLKLVRESLDGAARETVAESSESVFDGAAINGLFIHRGVAYASGMKEVHKKIDGKYVDVTTGVITAYPLDGGEPYTVMSLAPGWESFYGLIVRPMGNELYILLQGSNGKDLDAGEWGEEYSIMYVWSAETRRARLLFAESSDTFGKSPETHGIYPVRGDGVYFQNLTEYRCDDGTWASRAGLLKYSFASGQTETVTDALSVGNDDAFLWMTFFNGGAAGPLVSGDKKTSGKICFFDLEGKSTTSVNINSAVKRPGFTHIIETPLGDDGSFTYYYVRTMVFNNELTDMSVVEEFYLAVPKDGDVKDGSIRFDIYERSW